MGKVWQGVAFQCFQETVVCSKCVIVVSQLSKCQRFRFSMIPTPRLSSMDGCKTSTELCFVYIILYNYIHYFSLNDSTTWDACFQKKAKIRDVPQPLAFPSMTQTQVAISHSAGALLSLGALRIGGHDILVTGCWVRLLPGSLAHFRTWIGSMVMTSRDKSSDLPTRQGAWSTASS